MKLEIKQENRIDNAERNIGMIVFQLEKQQWQIIGIIATQIILALILAYSIFSGGG